MGNNEVRSNRAWLIGAAIEAGVDAQEARSRINAGEIAVPAAGAVIGGGVAATATGLGGVGLAFGGGAIGIGAFTAVAAPAVAAGAVSYGIYRGIRELNRMNREQTLRSLVEHFRSTGKPDHADRVFHIEGMGQLVEGRRPPAHSSARATLRLLDPSESSAMMGLFCSPRGEFVLTYDFQPDHWVYVMVIGDDKFSGSGTDLRGQEFRIDDLNSVDLVLRILEREGFLNLRQDPDGEQD